jgi:hypothetical protein
VKTARSAATPASSSPAAFPRPDEWARQVAQTKEQLERCGRGPGQFGFGIWGIWRSCTGAIDMERRVDVMDAQGVAEAFVFASGVGTIGMVATSISSPEMLLDLWDFNLGADHLGFELTTDVVRAIGGEFLKAHHEWCIKVAKTSRACAP